MNDLVEMLKSYAGSRSDGFAKLAVDAADEIERLRSQLVNVEGRWKRAINLLHSAYVKMFDGDKREEVRSYLYDTSSLIDDKPRCICQDQHRRGYCTEPTCPYYNPLTSAQRSEP